MDKKIGLFAGLMALFAVGSVHAQSCPGFSQAGTAINGETGHTFFLYKSTAPGISWAQANACVTGLAQQGGVSAHLATITSSSENTWIVDALLRPNLPLAFVDNPATSVIEPTASLTQVWVGGSQLIGSGEPDEGWSWENNEGPIPVPGSTVTLGYSNWSVAPLEPNNTGPSGERQLTLGRYGDLGRWNDEGSNLGSIGGFIVEYDTPRATGAGCVPVGDSTACTTVRGQTISFPPGTFLAGSNFTFTAYEFIDPRVDNDPLSLTYKRCTDRRQLEVFTESAFDLPTPGSGISGKIVIPEYLCGSPKFLVVRAVDNGISVPSGVVTTTNKTLELINGGSADDGILPDNFFDCESPIPVGGSPQKQDVGVWQDLNPDKMREYAVTNRAYFGSVAELTTACGSTVLKTIRKSNFVVGLHIDFGPDVGYQTQAEYLKMLELTQKKVQLLQQSVRDAIAEKRYVKNPDGQAMLSQLDSVYAALLANNLSTARKKIQDFLNKVNTSAYKSGPTLFNYNGDHLSRGENVRFMLDHKLIPFKNSP